MSSYRTYEEWKRKEKAFEFAMKKLFLPYLWGMETRFKNVVWVWEMSSYRTYEEWKLRESQEWWISLHQFLPYLWGMETVLKVIHNVNAFEVLTVPMRNGNRTWDTVHRYVYWVLTVPMRNGNQTKSGVRVCLGMRFLPYLWGMETHILPIRQQRLISSYRTYEEWKLPYCSPPRLVYEWFLPYLWGMETVKALL